MKTRILNIALIAFATVTFVFTSCKKEEGTTTTDTSIVETAQADASADNMFDEVYSEMDESVTDLEVSNYSTSALKSASTDGSKTVTVNKPDTTNYPKTITIVYNNWTDRAGRVKNGTILIEVTGPYRKVGSVKTISLQNFTIDSISIEGTHTVTNLGRNSEGYLQYSVTLENGKITLPDGRFMTREFNRTRTWVAGDITPKFIWDDAYLIEGSASGVHFNGNEYTRTIVNPLYLAAICPWVAKGTVQIVSGDKMMVIDYGSDNSVCDNKATVTINGVTKEITLPRGRKRL